jgi:hypothetical protein
MTLAQQPSPGIMSSSIQTQQLHDSLLLWRHQGLKKPDVNWQLPLFVLDHSDAPREIPSAQASTAGREWISPTVNH